MTKASRQDLLDKLKSPLGAAQAGPRGVAADGPASMGWDEIGFLTEGLSFAQRPIRAAAAQVTRQHGLGPRGAFILSLISGGVAYPNELALALKTGRSLITAELTRLTEAGLVAATPGETDRRRSRLSLTAAGEAACEATRAAMHRIVTRNLAAYTAEEVRLFARMLRDVRQLPPGEEEPDC